MASPYYPPYRNIVAALGLSPVVIETGAETRYQPTVAMLERLDPLPDGLIVASPCNPAGTMLHPDELAAIAVWCHGHGVRLISDEIYHGLHYGQPIATAAAFSPSAIVINSFSKYFSMTGWRIGWMVLPEDLVRGVECLAQNLFISAPHISQVAAEAAFDCHDELAGNVERYRRSRALLLAGLPGAGFDRLSVAEGAFYIYADVGERTNDSLAFCARMLSEAGVAAASGVDFDADRGHRTMRFSYCGPEVDMAEAVERLRAFR
jgi:aspartate/methionine/tyrosine aminotransferase